MLAGIVMGRRVHVVVKTHTESREYTHTHECMTPSFSFTYPVTTRCVFENEYQFINILLL